MRLEIIILMMALKIKLMRLIIIILCIKRFEYSVSHSCLINRKIGNRKLGSNKRKRKKREEMEKMRNSIGNKNEESKKKR